MRKDTWLKYPVLVDDSQSTPEGESPCKYTGVQARPREEPPRLTQLALA